MIKSLYSRWINDWEKHLCFRSTDRVVRPFEWGLDWAERWPVAHDLPYGGEGPEKWLLELNRLAIEKSDEFFGYVPPESFRLEGGFVRFQSAAPSPHPVNNVVHGQWFPAEKHNGKAVIVLPHWNASQNQHGGLCQGLAKFGLSAVRLSLPYHDFRMPAELRRADYAMSSNIGRTIDATRQAVIDIRATIDWLYQMGYKRIGICGTSIGSCYACLASAHDARINVNVFNHCSTYVADVVWTGLSTIHVKQGLEERVNLDQLRNLWNAISPVNFLEKLAKHKDKRSLFIYTEYDTTFIPRLSEDIVGAVKRLGIASKVVVLPCGHYTMGESPFKFMDGYHIINFLKAKPVIDIPALLLLISEWNDPADGEAEKSRELCAALLRETPSPLSRNQFTPGHITGTACILHPFEDSVLLVHHRKLDRWLLPGGHVEPGLDVHVAETARREAEEEAGVQIDLILPPRLVGIDVHGIPGRKKEPFHLHHDLIFSFRAVSENFLGSEEVRGLVWCALGHFDRYDLPHPIRRAVQRSIAY